jgi:hypothetical protein
LYCVGCFEAEEGTVCGGTESTCNIPSGIHHQVRLSGAYRYKHQIYATEACGHSYHGGGWNPSGILYCRMQPFGCRAKLHNLLEKCGLGILKRYSRTCASLRVTSLNRRSSKHKVVKRAAENIVRIILELEKHETHLCTWQLAQFLPRSLAF